ncbi:MAG: hypothetical protein KJ648_05710 [Candidatus Omnitrophica bacterium]|nr:hypothetical protein [Candidatus Omnitrophota bacterium]
MLANILYANDWDQWLPGPYGVAIAWGASEIHLKTGSLYTGGYLTNLDFWKCPSAQALNPMVGTTSTPRAFDYTVSMTGYFKPYNEASAAGTLDANDMMVFASGGPPGGDELNPAKTRKITSFPGPSKTMVYAEERAQTINDPYFSWDDVTEPRHINDSTAGCLDGHVILIPSKAEGVGSGSGGVCLYSDSCPKKAFLMPEYCPFTGWTAGGY